MTIAISLKINDGIVLAADSASTLVTEKSSVFNIYNNANKIFNLKKGFPVGVITWGAGNIGQASVSTLIKDLRHRFSGEDEEHSEWAIEGAFQVSDVAQRVKEFIYDEQYLSNMSAGHSEYLLGLIVAGYSTNSGFAEEYRIEIKGGECKGPIEVRPKKESGISWSGDGEALARLILGFGSNLPNILMQDLQVPSEQIEPVIEIIKRKLTIPLVVPAMPLQDAIDLAEFLVETTVRFSRYSPGPQTVGGPIEIAAISKHEGFKWVQRKHYYSQEFNPN